MKRAVLFDLIGTLLVARSRQPLSSLHAIFEDHGLSSTVDGFTAAWEEEKSIPSNTRHTPFEERISRVAKRLDWMPDWDHVEIIANDICDKAAIILSVDPEALDLLRKLHGYVKLGLVTNYDHPPAIYKMLTDEKLIDFFSVVMISGEIGIWKPDSRILHAAIDAMSFQPSDCIYVGDSDVDIEVAIAAGVDPIWIDREDKLMDPFRKPENDMKIKYHKMIGNQELTVIRKLREIEKFI